MGRQNRTEILVGEEWQIEGETGIKNCKKHCVGQRKETSEKKREKEAAVDERDAGKSKEGGEQDMKHNASEVGQEWEGRGTGVEGSKRNEAYIL